jgi:hypothetical protein
VLAMLHELKLFNAEFARVAQQAQQDALQLEEVGCSMLKVLGGGVVTGRYVGGMYDDDDTKNHQRSCVVCGVLRMLCVVWCVARGAWCAVCCVLCAVCCVLCAVCCAVCCVLCDCDLCAVRGQIQYSGDSNASARGGGCEPKGRSDKYPYADTCAAATTAITSAAAGVGIWHAAVR